MPSLVDEACERLGYPPERVTQIADYAANGDDWLRAIVRHHTLESAVGQSEAKGVAKALMNAMLFGDSSLAIGGSALTADWDADGKAKTGAELVKMKELSYAGAVTKDALVNGYVKDELEARGTLAGSTTEFVVDAAKEEALRAEDAECIVCFSEFSCGDACRKLPCGHFFHTECIDQWLLVRQRHRARTCPMCKRDPLRAEAPPPHAPLAAAPASGTAMSESTS